MDAKTKLFSQVPLFSRLKGKSLERVAHVADEVDVPAGMALTQEGATAAEFFVILEGNVEVTRGGGMLATLGPGDFLGEIALVDGGPRTATARTTTPARLVVLTTSQFHTLIDDEPEVRLCVLQALAARVRSLDASAS
jgi:CRP/FNR family cyclic AMP-dependent transcriptional regulator